MSLKSGMMVCGTVLMTVLTAVAQEADCPESGRTTDPPVVAAVAPQFPDLAVQARITGAFDVCVAVGSDGAPTRARFHGSGPARVLQGVSEAAALNWRFSAVTGDQADRVARLRFVFRLMPREGECAGRERGPETVVFRPPYEVEIRRCAGVVEASSR